MMLDDQQSGRRHLEHEAVHRNRPRGAPYRHFAIARPDAQMDAGAPRRSLIRRTARRIGSIAVIAAIVLAVLVVTPALVIAVEVSGEGGAARPVLDLLLAVVPPILATVALAAVYRLLPLTRATWRAIGPPAVAGAIALVVVTRVFIFITPRIFGANVVFGTGTSSPKFADEGMPSVMRMCGLASVRVLASVFRRR